MDVNVHYLTHNFVFCKKILRVFEMKEAKDADNDRKRIDESMVQFGIAEQGYTTDNEATMQKTLREDN